ncbi:hypothetical protein M422DRAFT_115801, partial [Sphaerobolus stellatus SS14]
DTINSSSTHHDIMVHTFNDPSSSGYLLYWYAHIQGIFHCVVKIMGDPNWKEVPLLWTRWLECADLGVQRKINPHFLDCVGFVTDDETESFGFIDLSNVICASHLI